MSTFEITLHGQFETDEGKALCDQMYASSWCVFVREYLPEGVIEVHEDEDFDTKPEAEKRASELQLKYPGADFEELL